MFFIFVPDSPLNARFFTPEQRSTPIQRQPPTGPASLSHRAWKWDPALRGPGDQLNDPQTSARSVLAIGYAGNVNRPRTFQSDQASQITSGVSDRAGGVLRVMLVLGTYSATAPGKSRHRGPQWQARKRSTGRRGWVRQ
ncbi:hypothetical protein PG994_003160 [Apiospora phragmitis]|uniref:Uncharacterized protein n=1 Tax=Apiospora phragmitis TaxID=2905665 RepID=A0ABR1WB17_9PEZI